MSLSKYISTRRLIIFSAAIAVGLNLAYFLQMYGVDFSIFYSASRLVLSGNPECVYDVAVHHQVLEQILNTKMPYLLAWFYPPFFLLLVWPMALIPYRLALYTWMVITLMGYAYTVHKILPRFETIVFSLGFPGVLMNMQWGQNGFLNVFLLGTGLMYIENNPALAGLMLSLLCYKPHYAFLPLLILLIGKHWKTLYWTVFFMFLLIISSITVFGIGPWQVYVEKLPVISQLIADDWINVNGIQTSFYSAIRIMTGNELTAMIGQLILSIVVTVLVCWAWRYLDDYFLKCAVLSTGVILITPYILIYDLVMLALPIAFYSAYLLKNGYVTIEAVLLSICFVLPFLSPLVLQYTGIQITSFVLILVLFCLFWRTRRNTTMVEATTNER